MSFRYQKFTECLISKQLGYEVTTTSLLHNFFALIPSDKTCFADRNECYKKNV